MNINPYASNLEVVTGADEDDGDIFFWRSLAPLKEFDHNPSRITSRRSSTSYNNRWSYKSLPSQNTMIASVVFETRVSSSATLSGNHKPDTV